MPLKPGGAQPWSIREQIIEDPATGLVFQFEVMPDGEMRFRVFGGSLPFGNREFAFDANGGMTASGTATGLCKPAWLTDVPP